MVYVLHPLLGHHETRSFDCYTRQNHTPYRVETSAGFNIAWFNSYSSYECIQCLVLDSARRQLLPFTPSMKCATHFQVTNRWKVPTSLVVEVWQTIVLWYGWKVVQVTKSSCRKAPHVSMALGNKATLGNLDLVDIVRTPLNQCIFPHSLT